MISEPLPEALPGLESVLADLLAQAPDLHAAGEAGLNFLLDAVHRSGGVLFIQTDDETRPEMVVDRGLSSSWFDQIHLPESPLLQLAKGCLVRGSSNPGTGKPHDSSTMEQLAAAVLVSSNAEIQGVLLLQGEPCAPAEVEWLAELAAPLGRDIRYRRGQDRQARRLESAFRLQSELAGLALRSNSEGFQRHLIARTCRLLESEAALLVLADQENPGWFVYKSLDRESKWAYHLQPDEGKGPVSDCMRTGGAIRLEGEHARLDLDPTCTDQHLLQARSLLCAPLRTEEQTYGAILVLNKLGGAYDLADQTMLASIGEMAAGGFQTADLIQQFKISRADLEANRWELLESRNFLRALFDHLPAGLYIIDQDYHLQAVNKSRSQRLGVESGELVGLTCHQVLFGSTAPCPDCLVRETLQEGRVTRRSERRRHNEELAEWEISTYPILDEQGNVSQAILLETDVTEKRHLESILVQSEKLAAVGQLAAGVAHEINNPLTAIIANAQILQRELPPDSDLQESVDLISRAGARAAQEVRNLLDFARKEEYRLGVTDVNETLERAVELVRHELLARGVLLESDLDPNIPSILASADMLQSVWLNLLMNAIDSLDKSPAKIRVALRKTGKELVVSVTDNGKGIPAEHLSRVFEPFYTTKAPGRGTGLGLSVSHRIIRQHGGHFRVESQVGEGSIFTVILPLA